MQFPPLSGKYALNKIYVDDRLLPPLRRLLPLFVYYLGTLMAMSALNIPISPIWAGLGIGGIAVALAVQPTLANFFAGTYVVTEGELNMGDYIELSGGKNILIDTSTDLRQQA